MFMQLGLYSRRYYLVVVNTYEKVVSTRTGSITNVRNC